MSNTAAVSADTSSASTGYITEKLTNARQALIEKGLYLGVNNSDLQRKLTWARDGKAELLVTVEATKAAGAACNAHNATGGKTQTETPTAIEPAILSAVVQISEENYWLLSCGGWKGPTDISPTLADVKATCVGLVPKHETFAKDFSNVLENVEILLDMGCTNGYAQRKGVLKGNTSLKFRHVLFQPVGKEEGQGSEDSATTLESESEDIPREYTIAGWSADSAQAQEELRAMVDTHRVNYIEAYDMHGRLIDPREYRKNLQGALVQIHFSLTHWSIKERAGKQSCDTFVADIYSMRVLTPPDACGKPVVPRKRRFYRTDPLTPDISPKEFKVFAKSSGSRKKVKN